MTKNKDRIKKTGNATHDIQQDADFLFVLFFLLLSIFHNLKFKILHWNLTQKKHKSLKEHKIENM